MYVFGINASKNAMGAELLVEVRSVTVKEGKHYVNFSEILCVLEEDYRTLVR